MKDLHRQQALRGQIEAVQAAISSLQRLESFLQAQYRALTAEVRTTYQTAMANTQVSAEEYQQQLDNVSRLVSQLRGASGGRHG